MINHEHQDQKKYTDDPDVQLMLAFQKGDPQAFEQLMTKYYTRILNFIYRYVGRREVAEDLTQEVFIRVYNSAHRYRAAAKVQTWLYVIAKNISLNELRRTKRPTYSLDAPLDTGEGEVGTQMQDERAQAPDEAALRKERADHVQAAIQALPENQRMAVLLRRYEQMSYEDIAAAMKTTPKAVKSLLNRAKENLKNSLKAFIQTVE